LSEFFIPRYTSKTVKDGSKAIVLGLTAVLIWSTVATAFKITLRSMEPPTMVFISTLFSLVSISAYCALKGKLPLILETPRKDMIKFLIVGLLNPFIYYIVLFGSYDELPAQIAQSINYSWPIVLTILSILILDRKARLRSIIGIVLGFAGVVTVSTRGFMEIGGGIEPLGIFLASASAVIWAVFWTINLKLEGPPESKLFFNFLGGGIAISLILPFLQPSVPDLNGWLAAGYVGFFEMGLTFLIWLNAISLTRETAKISTLIYLSPFISLILIAAILGERILPSTVAGLLLIVSALVLQASSGKKST
jgi:drug/metabolite transporter (DMT)-like permease